MPGGEADEVDVVVGVRVEARHLVGSEPEPGGGRLQLEAQLAPVAARQLHGADGRQDLRTRLIQEFPERGGQRLVADHERLVVDEQRAIARNGLVDPGHASLPDQVLESQDAGVDVPGDLVAQLDGERAVPARQEPRLEPDRHRGEVIRSLPACGSAGP
jgi:hypothetical protein